MPARSLTKSVGFDAQRTASSSLTRDQRRWRPPHIPEGSERAGAHARADARERRGISARGGVEQHGGSEFFGLSHSGRLSSEVMSGPTQHRLREKTARRPSRSPSRKVSTEPARKMREGNRHGTRQLAHALSRTNGRSSYYLLEGGGRVALIFPCVHRFLNGVKVGTIVRPTTRVANTDTRAY